MLPPVSFDHTKIKSLDWLGWDSAEKRGAAESRRPESGAMSISLLMWAVLLPGQRRGYYHTAIIDHTKNKMGFNLDKTLKFAREVNEEM